MRKLFSELNISRVTLILLSLSLFVFSRDIFNGIIHTKYFILYVTIGLLLSYVIIEILIKNIKPYINLDIVDLLLISFLFYCCIRYYDKGNIYYFNSKPSLLLIAIIFFFIIKKVLISHGKNGIKTGVIFVKGLLIISILQSLIGILQLYGVIDSINSNYVMSGSMVNTALFAMLLAVIYPLSLYYYIYNKDIISSKTIYYLSMFSLISILSVIPFTENRISWITIFLSTLLIFSYKYRLHIKRFYKAVFSEKMILCLSIFLAFIVISVVAICLFKYKEGSSLGRMLVWKISLMHIKEWFVTGVGFGGFEYNYNKWQAEYFINNPDDITNARLADYIQFAYNEFLQNFIECGIIGFLLFVFIIGLIFRNIIIKVKNSNKIIALFTIPFSVSFFAITIMFLTSYPLQNLYLLLIFFTITAMLSHGMPNIIKIYRSQTLSFVIMIVAIFFSFSQLKYIKPLTKWHKANVLYYDEDYLQSVAIYSEIFDSMNKDPLFLQFYAKSLQMAREYQKSTSVLNVSNKRRTDQQAYICLAVDYIAMQMYDEAESNLLYASHLIPNKLYPIYLLAKTFYDAGDMEKAKKYAIVGINFPVKIQSAAINEMQNELQNILINVQEKIQ